MAGGFGVKIDIKVGTKKSELRKQIQDAVTEAVAKTPITVNNIKFTVSAETKKALTSNIKTYLDKNAFKLKIESINADKAVARLRKQLSDMLSGLEISGLKEFVGDTGMTDAMQKAANNLDKQNEKLQKTKKVASEAEGYIKTINKAMSGLDSAFGTAAKSGMFADAKGTEQLKAWSAEISALKIRLEELKQTKLTATKEEFAKLLNAIVDTTSGVTRLSKATKDLPANVTSVSNLMKRISEYIRLNPRAVKEFPQLNGYLQTLNERATEITRGELANISSLFTDITTKARAMGIEGRSALDFLKEGFKKFGGWSLVTKSLMAAVRIVRQMVTNVIELDSAMTELKKVTNETDAAYDNFLKGATSTAKQIGATLTDTVSATADFARLGYNVDQAAELAEAALVYKNVGDGMADINEASESLISTMQAFSVETTDAMLVIDKFNEVANNFAISSGGIGQALQRSAAAMKAANNDLDQTIALITAANTIVQNPESVGTTLKTISMYLRAAKTEAEEAGESTEGMAGSVSELREEILALTGGKVDIMISDTEFRSTYDILKSLSEVWDDLTDVSRANILESIAGKRNANVASALIENFEKAEEVLATSSTAAGSALEENEKYLESINGKISIMKATFEDASQSIVDSDIVAVFVDISTVLLDIIGSLAKINVLVPSILTSFGSIQGLGMLKSNTSGVTTFFEGLATSNIDDLVKTFQSMSNFQQNGILKILQDPEIFERLNSISGDLELTAEKLAVKLFDLGYASDDTGNKVGGLSDAIADVVNKSGGFKKSIGNIWSSMNVLSKASIIAAAIMLVFSAVKALAEWRNKASERYYEEAVAIKDEYDSLTEDISTKTEEISENQKRILELNDKLSSGTITFIEEQELNNLKETNQQLEYILQTKKELQEMEAQEYNDKLVESFDEKKYSMSKVDDDIVEAIRSSYQRQIQELEAEMASVDSSNTLSETEKTARINTLQSEINLIAQSNEQLKALSFTQEGYLALLVDARNELDVIRQKNGVLTKEQLADYNAIEKELKSILLDVNDNYLSQYIGDGSGKDQFQAVVDYIRGILDPTEQIKSSLEDIDGAAKKSLETLGKEGGLTAEKVLELKNYSESLRNVLERVGGDENSAAAKVAEYFNALAFASDAVSVSTHDMYKQLSQLEDEMRRLSEHGGNVDLSNRNTVYIDKNNINRVRSWHGFENAQIGEYMTVASQTYNANGAALVVTPILPNGDVLSQAELDAYIRGIIRESGTTGNTNFAEIDNKNIVLGVFDESGWANNLEAADKFSVRLHEAHEQIIQIKNDIGSIDMNLLPGSVVDVSPAYEAAEKYSETQDLIAKAQEEMRTSGSISTDTMKGLAEITDEYTKYLLTENDAIKLNVDAFKEYSSSAFNENIDTINANISALKDYRKALLEKGRAGRRSESERAAIQAELEANEELVTLLEEQLRLYNAIKEALSEKTGMDGLKAALGETETELEKAEKAIARIGAGEFEALSGVDFTNILTALPEVRADLIACAEAAKNGNLSLAQQEEIYKKLCDAAQSLKATKVASALEKIADSANDFGVESFETRNALQELSEYAPLLAEGLIDAETGLLNTAGAAEVTAQSLLAIARISLDTSIVRMTAQLGELRTALAGVSDSTNASFNKSVAEIYSEKIASVEDAIADRVEELATGEKAGQIIIAGGGGSSSTPADKIKESFDSLNSSLEHSIFLQQQYYKDAEESLDSQAMRASLLKQIEYYKQIQTEAHKAAEQLRAYYRSQGLTAAQIEMQSEIQDLSKTWWAAADSIDEATKSIQEDIVKAFSDSVDEIQKVYDTLHDAADEYAESGYITVDVLQDIISMGVEYLAYLQNENGQLVINEENIQKVIKARTEQMAVESALAYVEALRAAKEANNVEELNRLLSATQATTGATWGLVYASLAMAGLSNDQYNAALKNINSLRALANSAIESVGKTSEKTSDVLKEMKDGVDDILKHVMDMIRHEIESQVEALEDLKDSYSELIELKKESLEATKDESDYTEQVAEITKKLAKLQSDIDLLDLVGTREAEAQKSALLEEQAELQKELANLQGDYAYDAQVEALDKMEEAYHESKDNEIKALEDKISSEEKIYQLAIDRIENEWDTLYQQLIDWNYSYGNTLQKDLESAWSNALAAAQRYGSFVSALNSLPGDIEAAGSSSPNYIVGNTYNDSSFTNEEAIRSLVDAMKANASAWHTSSSDQQKYLEERNESIAEQLKAFGLNLYKKSGVWYLDDGRKLFEVYHQGGIVGGGTSKEEEQFALLKKKEWVLSETMVDGLLKKLSLFDKVGTVFTKLTDIMSQAYRPGVGNLVHDGPPSYFSENNRRSVQISIGDTYISGADENTIRQHQQINKKFMDDLATQLGVRW